VIQSALLALRQSVSPPFRSVLLKSVGLALLLLVVLGVGLQALVARLIEIDNQNLDFVATIIASFGIVIGLVFLVPPVTSLMAGIFLDEIAATVERTHYPQDAPGRDLPLGQSILMSVKFFGVVVLVNIGVLVLLLLPGVNIVLYLIANGYLLGREYFELAAARFHGVEAARALRRRHAPTVFLGGVLIAGFVAIPILNLATPLVATAFMVHLQKRIAQRDPVLARLRATNEAEA
jgi:CysZ protein